MTKKIDKSNGFIIEPNKKQELDRILINTGGNVKSSVEGLVDLRPKAPEPRKKS